MTTTNDGKCRVDIDFKTIILDCRDNIATITLNRPEVYNALSREMILELSVAFDFLQGNSDIRVLILTGGEKVFAAGADISQLSGIAPTQARDLNFNDTFQKIEKLDFPVIAAIAGHALGGGLELALACDIRICSKNAKLGMPEIKLGIFPGAGGTQRLPRLIGVARAKEMIFLGDLIDADTAFNYGLCTRIAKGNLLEEAISLAKILAAGPKVALSLAKKMIDKGMNSDLNTAISFETVVWSDLFSTHDQQEGMTAFLEKRKAVFLGK